jgi:nitrogen PTS system EIIA component
MNLSSILGPRRIKVPLAGRTKEECIAELVDLLVADGALTDREQALEAVLARERTRTTGVGDGLALPHGKCRCASGLSMAIGMPSGPLEFHSVDHEPVRVVVLLVSSPEQTGRHIQALARLTRLMSFPTLRRRLFRAGSPEEILDLILDCDWTIG